MLITRLCDYLQQQQRASVQDLALHLDSSTESVQAMLTLLHRKQRVRLVEEADTACSKCSSGDCPKSPIYEWIG